MKDSIIKDIQAGKLDTFPELIDRYKDLVFSIVLRMVKNKEDAEEIAQDTFVKAYQSIRQFKGNSKFSTWLYKIAYFTAINHLRKKNLLNSTVDLNSIESKNDAVLNSLEAEDRNKHLQVAINYLRPIDRNLVHLFYWDELSIKEIETITNLTAANIKVRLLRVRKQLNGILTALLKDEIHTFIKK